MNTLVPYLQSAVFPVAIQVLYHRNSDIQKRALWLSAFMIAILANSAAFVASLLFGGHVTEYEFLFVSVLASVGLTMLLFPLVRRAKLDHIHILKIFCVFCICSAVYSILTYGQSHIHGDIATASLLTKAQLDHGSLFPRSWCYVNGDLWVISIHSFVAPFALLLQNQSLARMLGSAALVLASVFVIIRHSKTAFHDDSWVIFLPVLLIFLYQTRDMILYQAAYTDQLIFLLGGIFLLFQIQQPGHKVCSALFCGLMVIMVMGGIRFVAEIVLPLWLAALVVDYLKIRTCSQIPWKNTLKKWLRISLCILVPAAIGYAIHLWITSGGIVVNTAQNSLRLADSIFAAADNISTYVRNLFFCFGFQGSVPVTSLYGIRSMVSVLMCLLVIFVVPVLQAIKIKEEDGYVQFFFAFTMIHNLIIFVMTVFFVGKTLHHYLLTSIFLTVFISARYIFKYWICQIHFDKYIWTALFITATAIGILALVLTSVGWKDTLANKKDLPQQLVDRGLTKGYGDFWHVYPNEVYSDFALRFGGVEVKDGVLTPYHWLVDSKVFQPEDTRTFLLISEEEREAVTAIIETQFRKPEDYFSAGNYHVYVFGYDIAADMN